MILNVNMKYIIQGISSQFTAWNDVERKLIAPFFMIWSTLASLLKCVCVLKCEIKVAEENVQRAQSPFSL